MDSIKLEPKLIGDIEGEFHIPAYQRGYRWKEEVAMLLNDIKEINEGENYSLQPIVVKKKAEKEYELIDGQQRLTTIFLIYRYIKFFLPKNKIKFNIQYDIRRNSRKFLNELDFENLKNIEPENVDEYFITEAGKTIIEWFEKQDDETQSAIDINTKLNKKIRVIWYEVSSNEDSIALFTRLNIGRIPLRNSELVKALFLSRNNGIDNRKQLEIATEWDRIEKELHNDNFWYFITNKDARQYPTRIELIFDLMANKSANEKEKFFTFFYFDNRIKESQEKSEIWTEIQRYYQRLKGWYENNDIYHKIGYLITAESLKTQKKSETIKLQDLVEKSKTITKTEFQNSLDELIAQSINYNKEYSDLSYDNPTDYPNITKLLLLFNIETVRQKSDETLRFPFEKHKQETWSLEHIHAQQSEGLNKKEQWIEWLELHKKSLMNIDENKNKDLINQLQNAINNPKLSFEIFSQLFKTVIKELSEEGSIEYTHSLSNMALLGQPGNSALNNATFAVKRDKILEMDKKNDYIPVCTRQVFLKYYTPSELNQLHFWGKADRDAYLNEMDRVLKNYLTIINKKIAI
ncbi:MAG: DUF262 domain-containing protein [Chlorobi bacterium]|nr:DUF262 domain-containing protein [Chlorobiota bacterium]